MSTRRSNRGYENKSSKTNVDQKLSISNTNVRGLRSNFPEVKYHLHGVKPDVIHLLETGLSESLPVQFTSLYHSIPIVKHDTCNVHSH